MVRFSKKGVDDLSFAMRNKRVVLLLIGTNFLVSVCLVFYRFSSGSQATNDSIQAPLPGALQRSDMPGLLGLSNHSEEIQTLRTQSFEKAEAFAIGNRGNVSAICLLAKLHLRLGNAKEARNIWLECASFAPESSEPLLDLGFYETKSGNDEAAKGHFEKAIEIDPGRIEGYVPLVTIYLKLGESEKAKRLAQKLIESNVRSDSYWLLLGKAYTLAEDWKQARYAFDKAMAWNPYNRDAAFGQLMVCRSMGDNVGMTRYETKLTAIDKLASIDSKTRSELDVDLDRARDLAKFVYSTVAQIQREQREPENAVQTELELVRLIPSDLELRSNLLRTLEKTKPELALQLLKEAADQFPSKPEVLMAYARQCMKLRKLDDAQLALTNYIRIKPDDSVGYCLLSQVEMPKGRNPSVGLTHAKKAVELAPLSSNFYVLATAFYHNGDPGQARKYLQQSLSLDPYNEEAILALSNLDKEESR